MIDILKNIGVEFWLITIFLMICVISFLLFKIKKQNLYFEQESEWYKKALDFSRMGLYRWDSTTDKWEWSDKLFEIRGMNNSKNKEAEIITFYDNVAQEHKEKLKKALERCKFKGKPINVEYKYILNSGEVKWFKEKASIIKNGRNYIIYGVVIDITDQKMKEEQLEYYAQRDNLTKISNRAGFDRYLAETMKSLDAKHQSVILSFIDLNGFKAVNDNFGHEFGDLALKMVSSCLTSRISANDFVARIGGDEFVLITKTLHENLQEDIARLSKLLKEVFDDVQKELEDKSVGAAIGMSVFPQQANDIKDLLSNADSAMYSAKRTKEFFKIFLYKESV